MLCFIQWVKESELSHTLSDINKLKNISRT